jgi:hypothetical protein
MYMPCGYPKEQFARDRWGKNTKGEHYREAFDTDDKIRNRGEFIMAKRIIKNPTAGPPFRCSECGAMHKKTGEPFKGKRSVASHIVRAHGGRKRQ